MNTVVVWRCQTKKEKYRCCKGWFLGVIIFVSCEGSSLFMQQHAGDGSSPWKAFVWIQNTNVDCNGNAAKSEVFPIMTHALFWSYVFSIPASEACRPLSWGELICRHSKRVITKIHVTYKYELKYHTDLPSLQVGLRHTAAPISPFKCTAIGFCAPRGMQTNKINTTVLKCTLESGPDLSTPQTNQLRLMTRVQGFQLGWSCWINYLMSR